MPKPPFSYEIQCCNDRVHKLFGRQVFLVRPDQKGQVFRHLAAFNGFDTGLLKFEAKS